MSIYARSGRLGRRSHAGSVHHFVDRTLGAIAGPIAEALHGTPEHLVATAKERYLSEVSNIRRVMERMYASPP